VAGLMAIAGVVFLHPILLLIAGFVYVAGGRELRMVVAQRAQTPVLVFDPKKGWHYQMGGPGKSPTGEGLRDQIGAILRRLFRDR